MHFFLNNDAYILLMRVIFKRLQASIHLLESRLTMNIMKYHQFKNTATKIRIMFLKIISLCLQGIHLTRKFNNKI